MKTLLLVLACCSAIFAQKQPAKPCALTIEQSPALRGLRLGQSVEQLPKILPQRLWLKRQNNEIGQWMEIFTSGSLEDRELLKGISILTVSYLDDALASISVTYDSSVKWESEPHFTSAVADRLKLPRQGWVKSVAGPRLDCADFFVEIPTTNHLVIERTDYAQEIQKRKAALERKKRVEFKP